MNYRPLGNSGLLVSEIVLGTVPFGGSGGFEKAASVDVAGAKRQLDLALDAGVNLIDTADLYSMGEAEEIVGKALGDKRQEVILASKARSPLGEGLFNGKVRRSQKAPEGTRQGNGWPEPYVHDMQRAYDIIELLAEIGEAHLKDDLAAAEMTLTPEEIGRIEAATRPAPQYPYWHRIVANMDRIDKAERPFIDGYRKTIDARDDAR